MNVTAVTTSDWQMSVRGLGEIAQNSADINQCLNTILSTQKGSDPCRYDFGIDILKFIDQPVNIVAPILVQQIISQVSLYETRIDLSTVNYSTVGPAKGSNLPVLDLGGTLFVLTWSFKLGTLSEGKAIANTDNQTTYFLLADQNGFVLLTDYDVSLIVN
jgi:phage baseplate assembly protein W